MEKFPTWIPVVALALRRSDGDWLMHRRPLEKAHGGLWEFPGGKVESGEHPVNALIREIDEELGIEIRDRDLSPACFAQSGLVSHELPIVILLYECDRCEGQPDAREGGEIGWFSEEEIALLEMPPLDVELARKLFAKTRC